LYSVTEQPPNVVNNTYTTTLVSQNSTFAVFDTSRPLSGSNNSQSEGNTYVIPLDEPFPIVWAFYETQTLEVQYHDAQRGA